MHSMHAPLRPRVLGTQTARIEGLRAVIEWNYIKRNLNLTKPGEEIDMRTLEKTTPLLHCLQGLWELFGH